MGSGMRLKTRLALIAALSLSALALCYGLLLLLTLPARANAAAQRNLPALLSLLPGQVDSALPDAAAQQQALVALLQRIDGLRDVRVLLRAPDGTLLASAPAAQAPAPSWLAAPPPWLTAWLAARVAAPAAAARKNVFDGARLAAYFELLPATDDALAGLWPGFLRSVALAAALALAALLALLLLGLRALAPLVQIGAALRALAAGRPAAPLPACASPDLRAIAQSVHGIAQQRSAAQAGQQALLRKLLASQERTRRALAHDLHDELSPHLVALGPLLHGLQLQCRERPELRAFAASVDTLSRHQSHILGRLRAILMGLHPPELASLGLRGAIGQLATQSIERADGSAIRVVLHLGGSWSSFGAALDLNIYRLLQECLNNARRHGTGARVDVRLDARAQAQGRGRIAIEVVNACGAQHGGGGCGLGLAGMRERCMALGGSFEAGLTDSGDSGDTADAADAADAAAAGRQWRVRIHLPLPPVQSPKRHRPGRSVAHNQP